MSPIETLIPDVKDIVIIHEVLDGVYRIRNKGVGGGRGEEGEMRIIKRTLKVLRIKKYRSPIKTLIYECVMLVVFFSLLQKRRRCGMLDNETTHH